jgi:hypothetical protein
MQTAMTEVYWVQAREFVKKATTDPRSPPWYELRLDSGEELWAWAAYFQRRFGCMPAGLKGLDDRKIQVFLVPCQWPEWFDPDYRPPEKLSAWPVADHVPVVTDASRARVQRMLDVIHMGQGKYTTRATEPKGWEPPSDDDLRRHYGRKDDGSSSAA